MDSKLNNGLDTDWARAPPPHRPFYEKFARLIYDPDEKSFLGRTPKRWGIVFAFYAVFYAVLAILFALCMGGLFLTLDDKIPKFKLAGSLIGANPGVAHRPRPTSGLVVEYGVNNSTLTDQYVHQIEDFLKDYENHSWVTSQKECSAEDNYGFPDSPCFFIKLNKIYDWVPDFYEATNEMPEHLANYISSVSPPEQHQVWVSCEEEKTNTSRIEYPWGYGFPSSFYPYRNEPGYKSPLVAVKITLTPNTLTTIRCRAWAKNIIYNKSLKEPSGYTRFQIYFEDTTQSNETETAA